MKYSTDYETDMSNSQNDTQGDTQENANDDIQKRVVSMIKQNARIFTALIWQISWEY